NALRLPANPTIVTSSPAAGSTWMRPWLRISPISPATPALSQAIVGPGPASSLDGTRPTQSDVEVAHRRDEHREDGEAVDAGADQECGHEVAVDQADDTVERPERCQDRDQRDGMRGIPGTH